MNNKLDSFNKDKVKCKKCKEYYDYDIKYDTKIMCKSCSAEWHEVYWNINIIKYPKARDIHRAFNDWCNNEQVQ